MGALEAALVALPGVDYLMHGGRKDAMITKVDPYRAPGSQAEGEAPSAAFLLATKVFLGWLAGGALLGGTAIAWQTAHALAVFGAESRTTALTAVSALRVGATQVAMSAASVALVVTTHYHIGPCTERRPAWPLWRIYTLVPLGMPVAACIMTGASVVVGLAYNVPATVSWHLVGETAIPGDLLFGLACAFLQALLLGAIAFATVPMLAGVRVGLAAKIVVTLVATALIGGTVRGALLACLDEEDVRAPNSGPDVPSP